jgi:indole-3-glycerol phosphate synthase
MNKTFLEKVTAETRERVAAARSFGYYPKLLRKAEKVAAERRSGSFREALLRPGSVNIIAEIKRASPSKGVIRAETDVAQIAKLYTAGGAAAISVLTEPNHFVGSIVDLITAVRTTKLPILRKDFIVDEFQIVESAAAGASAVLLIVAALPTDELKDLHETATNLGLEVLVEVHDGEEMAKAADIGASIIGVNNRNLHSLEVSLDVSRELIEKRPAGSIIIAESGITSRDEIYELRTLGYNGFLIGETLMRSGNIVETLRGLNE